MVQSFRSLIRFQKKYAHFIINFITKEKLLIFRNQTSTILLSYWKNALTFSNREGQLEEAITLDELKSVVINSKNYKSPGHYGLTNIFYKTFWPEIGNFLLDLMNYYNEQGELNDTQKTGIMTFIPKVNKNLKQLKNWCPITLLNSMQYIIFFQPLQLKELKVSWTKLFITRRRIL